MDILWSLGLIVFLLLALNHMAGGRLSNMLRPVSGIANGVFSLVVRLCMSAVGTVARLLGALLGGSLKLPPAGSKTNRESGPTPPRWDD